MSALHEIEDRLKVYQKFLDDPLPENTFSERSYERKAYRVALRRAIEDGNELLLLLKESFVEKPIPLLKIKQSPKYMQVYAQVRAQVWSQVRDQVRDQVRYQVWSQVYDQVRGQVLAYRSGVINEIIRNRT